MACAALWLSLLPQRQTIRQRKAGSGEVALRRRCWSRAVDRLRVTSRARCSEAHLFVIAGLSARPAATFAIVIAVFNAG